MINSQFSIFNSRTPKHLKSTINRFFDNWILLFDNSRHHMAGQAALILVLGLGLLGVVVSSAFVGFGARSVISQSAIADSEIAYFAAQSGIEELMIRLRSHHNFGNLWSLDQTLENGAAYHATISGDLNSKIATSTGVFGDYTRRIEVRVASDAGKTSFSFAVQSGDGGFQLEKNTQIIGVNNTPGNAYSNGDILGESNSSGNAGSRILGDVWSAGKISGLSGDDRGGVYIKGDLEANEVVRCQVDGDIIAPTPPLNCPYGGTYTVGQAPEPIVLEAIDIDFWKQQAEGASTWSGNCIIGGDPASDCSAPTNSIGSLKIAGNLTINSGSHITITGPVWVEGDISISSNTTVNVAESLGTEGVVIIADYPADQYARGKVNVSSNVTFNSTSLGGPVVLATTNTEDICSATPAIRASSNTATVVFYALDGCVFFESNSLVKGVLANTVYLSSNSTIEYDPRLAKVILKTGLGGWAVTSFKELD